MRDRDLKYRYRGKNVEKLLIERGNIEFRCGKLFNECGNILNECGNILYKC